ncbi:hypothetical protein GCM10010392_30230 [Streptomyces clavifer]|nr:hypothetical protein GCM10010392_30230 [Streptomyces clavifer]
MICGATSCAGLLVPGRGATVFRGGSTETQPETAVTAIPTRSVAVIPVRCTWATLPGRCLSGTAATPGLARTSDAVGGVSRAGTSRIHAGSTTWRVVSPGIGHAFSSHET